MVAKNILYFNVIHHAQKWTKYSRHSLGNLKYANINIISKWSVKGFWFFVFPNKLEDNKIRLNTIKCYLKMSKSYSK